MSAQRIAVTEPNTVQLEPFTPPPPQAGELLIETQTSLISPGTERAFYLALPNTNASYPLYPGYSNIGIVREVGDGVTAFQPGDRVATGTAHASHVIAPESKAVRVPDSVQDEAAVFFNLMAIAMQAVHKARIDLGESVAVVGAGLIGLFAARLSQISGGLPVFAVDLAEERLSIATPAWADAAINASSDVRAQMAKHGVNDGASIVIEASGAAPAVVSAFQMAAQRGRVLLLGSARGITPEVNFYRDVHRKGLTVIGAHEINRPSVDETPGFWRQTSEWDIALRLMAAGRIDPTPLISHRFAAVDFGQGYDLLEGSKPGVMGMVINWT